MKLQQTIQLEKYNRLFTFGCSFTNYKWPMWPEILNLKMSNHYNFGEAGADNKIIFHRVLEADAVFNFSPDDLILIMWTTPWRDSYFHPKRSLVFKRVEVNELVFQQISFLFRDLNYIKATLNFLENKNVDFDFLSMAGFSKKIMCGYHLLDITAQEKNELTRLYSCYQAVIDQIKISMFESVYNCDWSKPPTGLQFSKACYNDHVANDNHPTVQMSLNYIKTIYPSFKADEQVSQFVKEYEEKISEKIITERIHPRREFTAILPQTCISYD